MHQEAPDYRALLDALGFPPIMGGAEDEETPEEDTPTAEEPASQEETPEPEAETPAETDNYEQRYNDLRSEFDRRNEFLAAIEGRHGPEAQAQALAQAGLEIEGDDDTPEEDEYVDPEDRLNQLEERLQQEAEARQQSELQQKEAEWLDDRLTEISKAEGRDLEDLEVQVVLTHALSNRDPHTGEPDMDGGQKLLQSLYSTAQDRLLKSKRNASKPGVGTAGEKKYNLSDDEDRIAAMVADMQELSDSES